MQVTLCDPYWSTSSVRYYNKGAIAILVECVDLKDVQNKHFVASSIKDLFDNIEAHKIIDFIKETRFYKQL